MRAFLYFLACLLALTCADDPTAATKDFSQSANDFTLDLFKILLKIYPGNVVSSPVSASTLLGVVHQGAGGNTLKQLSSVLHAEPAQTKQGYGRLSKSYKDDKVSQILEFANAAFLQENYEVKPELQDVLKKDFDADIKTLNFGNNVQAAKEINSWVSEKTHERIKELVKPDLLSSATRMVLTNAIYFKDSWKYLFKAVDTNLQTFYVNGGEEKQVSTMQQTAKLVTGSVQNMAASWLDLQFQSGRFSFLIVLPNEKAGLDEVVEALTSQDIRNIIEEKSETSAQLVRLYLPKFKLETSLELVEPLKQLGLTDAFDGKANFSGISEEPVFISDVVQKAEVEVDEKGATASAATAVILSRSMLVAPRPEPLEFRVDHPFLAFIIDLENKVPLFACRISDPA